MNVAKTFALDLAAPVTNERPIVCVLYHPHNQILQSKWHILQNSTTVQTIFCDRLREILIHSNLHSRANSTPGTVPCSTDRCKACLHLCADTSIRDPNGHRSVKRTFHLSERQPGIRHHLSVLQPHLCWWYFQVPCGLFFGASGWHLPQLQHACSPAL